jgi:hypothetical protein
LSEDDKSKVAPSPKRDNWLAMKSGTPIRKQDNEKDDRYRKLIERDNKIIQEFKYKSDEALYDKDDYATFNERDKKPMAERQIKSPMKEDNYKYTPTRPKYDKENRDYKEDPYLSFVQKSIKKYDYGSMPHYEDEWKKPKEKSYARKADYARTRNTPDVQKSYTVQSFTPQKPRLES